LLINEDYLVGEGVQVVENYAAIAQDSEDVGNPDLLKTLGGQLKIAYEERV
jgi:hypothetical protein